MNQSWIDSVYSDGSPLFLDNTEPNLFESVKIRVRFWKGSPVEEIWVKLIKNGAHLYEKAHWLKEEQGFVYYEHSITMTQQRISYQFLLKTKDRIYYYNQVGVFTTAQDILHDFVIQTEYHQPHWIKDAVFYQIFPERFCNGDQSLSVKDGEYQVNGYDTMQIRDWNKPAGTYDECHCADFYGGDIPGITQKIPYLKEMGFNAIYLNPIFLAPSVHKYDCIDYLHVDPHFGGDEALAELTKVLHENGMHLIVDISINHTGTAHKWFNRDKLFFDESVGAYHNPKSAERKYYTIYEDGSYECWDNVPELPKLNFDSEELRTALYKGGDSVLRKWLKPPYSIDGWRFDVADVMANFNQKQLAKEVWPEIRQSIREENPDAYILAEHWDDCVEYMQGNAWDATMNYYGFGRLIRQFYGAPDPFTERNPQLWPFTCQISAEDFKNRVEGYLSRMPFPFWQNQYNLYNSHDIGRFYSYPGIDEEKNRGAIIALFTMIGVPSVYYGDELGIDGMIGFFEGARYPMPWEKADRELPIKELHKKLAWLRREHKAFTEGSFRFLYAKEDVLAFARFDEKEAFITVLSAAKESRKVDLPLDLIGRTDKTFCEEVTGSSAENVIEDGKIRVTVDAMRSFVLHVLFR